MKTANIVLDRNLAKNIGLNQAIVFQKIHDFAPNDEQGWVDGDLSFLINFFPFFDLITLRNILNELVEERLLICSVPPNQEVNPSYRCNYESNLLDGVLL